MESFQLTVILLLIGGKSLGRKFGDIDFDEDDDEEDEDYEIYESEDEPSFSNDKCQEKEKPREKLKVTMMEYLLRENPISRYLLF